MASCFTHVRPELFDEEATHASGKREPAHPMSSHTYLYHWLMTSHRQIGTKIGFVKRHKASHIPTHPASGKGVPVLVWSSIVWAKFLLCTCHAVVAWSATFSSRSVSIRCLSLSSLALSLSGKSRIVQNLPILDRVAPPWLANVLSRCAAPGQRKGTWQSLRWYLLGSVIAAGRV